MNSPSLTIRGGLDRVALAGIGLMLLGYFMFSLNDAMGKWLVTGYSVAQVLLVRSIGAFLLITPALLRQPAGTLWRLERPGLQGLRALMATLDTLLFYSATVYMPLADVMTFYMAGPIYMAAMSHLFLGERLSSRQWLAIGLGFIGVVIALRPSSAAFSWASLIALVGSVSFSVSLILGRRLRSTADPVLAGWQTIAALASAAGLLIGNWVFGDVVPGRWVATDWHALGAMLLLGCVACAAHLMMTRALKTLPASTLAPLQYTLLLWAVIFGYLFFGDLPDLQLVIGCSVIVVAGALLLRRR
ncbi:DMT family transporter [Pigmentiphaga aceris]|uniref:DMT family transporter n=1 Tax=Pigmentiphaga aceris TaxID=1940612 RepID=A0A5C0B1W1_9BURK|nr:DMT family transporter [Pigmentiphaga aceris]QEI06731.1 DMT family transporter [Pigmentiphaga aceris]